MYPNSAYSLVNRYLLEKRKKRLGIQTVSSGILKRDSLAEVENIIKRENLSRSLKLKVKKKFQELRKYKKRLETTLKHRDASLQEMTRKYLWEKSVLQEEHYRKKHIKGYKPKDYIFQYYGQVDPRVEYEDEDPSYFRIDHLDHLDPNQAKKVKSLMTILEELRSMKSEFIRRKRGTDEQLQRKAKILKISQENFTKKTMTYEQRLEALQEREKSNELNETEILLRESEIDRITSSIKTKKSELARLKQELSSKLSRNRRHMHSESSILRRRELNLLQKTIERETTLLSDVQTRLLRLRDELDILREDQRIFEHKRKQLLGELEYTESEKIRHREETVERRLHRKKRRRIRAERKKKEEEEKLRKQIEDSKKKQIEIEKSKKPKLQKQNSILIPDIQLGLVKSIHSAATSSRSSQEDEDSKKEIREVANEVTEFKREFKQLFTQFDVVKERMDFYNSSSTNNSTPSTTRFSSEGPKGVVAMVFTDVQSSTALWERSTTIMRASMQIHHDVARSLISKHNGYEVRTEGDAFFVTFKDPVDALKFSLGFQKELVDAPWPEELMDLDDATSSTAIVRSKSNGNLIFRGLRIRIGVHYDKPIMEKDAMTNRDDYYGPAVMKAQCVEGASTGGGIGISNDCFRAVRHLFGSDGEREVQIKTFGFRVALKSLGFVKLRGGKREMMRVILPYDLRERFNLAKKPDKKQFTDMRTLVKKLGERRQELDKRRGRIQNKLNFQIRMKSLNASNTEKSSIISYLKKKITHLKDTYENALEKRQNPFLGEEDKMRKEMDDVMGKYNSMTQMYRDLKSNFESVESVFDDRLKNELKRFSDELSSVTQKLAISQNRTRFNRQVMRIEKSVLEEKIERRENKIAESEQRIDVLKDELKQRVDERKGLYTMKAEDFVLEKHEETKLKDGDFDFDFEDEEDLEEILGELEDQKRREMYQELGGNERIGLVKNKEIQENQIMALPSCHTDSMISGPVELCFVVSGDVQEEMADKDMSDLLEYRKVLYSNGNSGSNSSASLQNDVLMKNCSEGFDLSRKQMKVIVQKNVAELKKKYEKLRVSNRWAGELRKLKRVIRMIRDLEKKLTNPFFDSDTSSPRLLVKKKRKKKRPSTAGIKKRKWGRVQAVTNRSDKKSEKNKSSRSSVRPKSVVHSSSRSRRRVISTRRNERVVIERLRIPKKYKDGITMSYSRLLESLPVLNPSKQLPHKLVSENKRLLNQLYYDKNALKYRHMLPRVDN